MPLRLKQFIAEKSASKSQQRLMGMALAYKRGELDNASDEVKKVANSMSTKDLEDFAKTKHDNLPESLDEAKGVGQFTVKKTSSWVDHGDPEDYSPDVKTTEYNILHKNKVVGTLTKDDYFGYVRGNLYGKDLPELSGYGSKKGSGPLSNLHTFLKSKTGKKWASTGKLRNKNILEAKTKWEKEWDGTFDTKGRKVYIWKTTDGKWELELTGYYQKYGRTPPSNKPNHTAWAVLDKGTGKYASNVYTSLAKAKAATQNELSESLDEANAKTKHDNTTTPQDSDIKDREGSQPKKYHAGLSKATKNARDAHFKKHGKKADDDASAYKPAPGDADAKTKPSKYTKAVNKMMDESLRSDIAKISSRFPERSSVKTKEGKKGVVVSVGKDFVKVAHGNRMKDYHPSQLTREEVEQVDEESKGLAAKAKKSGISVDTLKKVYNRGVAAWKTGHRPGTTPQQWGHARVNAFIVKKKKGGLNHDKDLSEANAKTLSIAQRRKAGRLLKRRKMRMKVARKRALRKTPNKDVLARRSRRAVRSSLFKKFSKGKGKQDISMSRRAGIERRINRLSPQRIKALATRQKRVTRKIDRQRRMGSTRK